MERFFVHLYAVLSPLISGGLRMSQHLISRVGPFSRHGSEALPDWSSRGSPYGTSTQIRRARKQRQDGYEEVGDKRRLFSRGPEFSGVYRVAITLSTPSTTAGLGNPPLFLVLLSSNVDTGFVLDAWTAISCFPKEVNILNSLQSVVS